MSETPEPEAVEIEPVSAIQNVLGEIGQDAMCVGFACVVEWLEQDGSRSIQVLHSDMPPWHLKGLLDWGTEMSTSFFVSNDSLLDEDDDDF